MAVIIPSNEMKIFDWLIRIQHLECNCQQIFQSTTSGFTTMNSNVKEQKGTITNTTDAQHHHVLHLQMQVTVQMLHLRTQVTLYKTLVTHECFKCRSKSRVQCVNLYYVPIKLFEIQIELFN